MTKLLESLIHNLLLGEQVGLDFKIEAVLVKEGDEGLRLHLSLFASAGVEQVRDLPSGKRTKRSTRSGVP